MSERGKKWAKDLSADCKMLKLGDARRDERESGQRKKSKSRNSRNRVTQAKKKKKRNEPVPSLQFSLMCDLRGVSRRSGV